MIAALMAVLATSQVGPLDGFRANLTSIKADVDFEYNHSIVAGKVLRDGIARSFLGFAPPANPASRVKGRWSCDGSGQRYLCEVPGYDPERPNRALLQVLRPSEVMFDQQLLVIYEHALPKQPIQVMEYKPIHHVVVGPFACWRTPPFPDAILADFPERPTLQKQISIEGRPLLLEVYATESPESRRRLEIAYDPAIGFLSRHARLIGDNADGPAAVLELFVVEALPCGGGGFVPTEWYEISYRVEDFRTEYPAVTEATRLVPTGQGTLGHYLATAVRDRHAPVALEEDPPALRIEGNGGAISRRILPARLTLDALRTGMGGKLKSKPSPMRNIDAGEVNETFEDPAWPKWRAYVLGGLVCACVGVGIYLARRRSSLLLLAIAAGAASGCGGKTEVASLSRLAARLESRIILHDGKNPKPIGLTISNEGGSTIRVFSVSG